MLPTIYGHVDFVRGCEYNVSCIYYCKFFLTKTGEIMEYLSVSQIAEKWNISKRRVQILCAEGRIPGTMRIGSYWAIPADAEKPKDERIRSGKYIKIND